MSFKELWMDVVEFLYDYKQLPLLFKLHAIIAVLLAVTILWLWYFKSQLTKMQRNPDSTLSRCHTMTPYVDYKAQKARQTEKALNELESSAEFQRYLASKTDPRSKYNRQIEVEEIVLSDDEQYAQVQRQQRQKAKNGHLD